MNTAELLKKVRHIEIHTKKLVNELFGGEYESVFKGQGIEFADIREYVPGDDIRTIDWHVTARSNQTFVKQFTETRELTVMFLVDMSGSQYFGSTEKLKSEVAAEITALLSFAAVKNKDKTGMIIATDEVEKFIPAKKGTNHVLRVVREILGYQPRKRKTHLKSAIEYLYRVLTRSSVIFLISDFLDSGYDKALKLLSQKHDVTAIQLQDTLENTLPKVGLVEWIDQETGKRRLLDTSPSRFREAFHHEAAKRERILSHLFKRAKIDRVIIPPSANYVDPLVKFFKSREKRT